MKSRAAASGDKGTRVIRKPASGKREVEREGRGARARNGKNNDSFRIVTILDVNSGTYKTIYYVLDNVCVLFCAQSL